VLSEALMIPVTSPKILGKVLRRYRKDLGFTQSKAGKKFNIPQKVVSNIESGRDGVHIVTIFRYMSALGLEMHLEFRDKSSSGGGLW
jgi:HTH-type transcriptional regulator/antitoxin HipB